MDELEAELPGFLGKRLDCPLAVPLLVLSHALVDVLLAFHHHRVDQPGQLVGAGGDGAGFVHAGAEPAVVCAKRGLTSAEVGGGQLQGLGGAVSPTT